MVMDSELEASIGLATQWPFRHLGEREVHVSASLLRILGVEPNQGQRITIQLDLNAALSVGLSPHPSIRKGAVVEKIF